MAKLKYNENFPVLAEGYARKGLIDKQIAKKLGISEDTYYRYIRDYQEFSEAIKRGKKPVDIEVESALLKRALGYDCEETVTEVRLNPDGTGQTTVIKKMKKHIPGEVGAQMAWLKNRKPDEWKDKHVLEHETHPMIEAVLNTLIENEQKHKNNID